MLRGLGATRITIENAAQLFEPKGYFSAPNWRRSRNTIV